LDLACFASSHHTHPATYIHVCASLKADKEKITFQCFPNYRRGRNDEFFYFFINLINYSQMGDNEKSTLINSKRAVIRRKAHSLV
jgi:hypothetical protein